MIATGTLAWASQLCTSTAANELTPHCDDHAWPQIHASIMFMCGVSFLMTTSCL